MHWMREYHKQVLLGLKFLLSRGLPLVLVSAAAAGVFLLKTPNSAKQASAPGARDPNATVGLRPHRTGISHSGGAAGDRPARRQLYGNSTVYSIRSGNGTARRTGCGKSPDHSSKVRKRAIYSCTCKWLVFVDVIALSRSPAASAYPAPPRRRGRGAPSPPARNISAGG